MGLHVTDVFLGSSQYVACLPIPQTQRSTQREILWVLCISSPGNEKPRTWSMEVRGSSWLPESIRDRGTP